MAARGFILVPVAVALSLLAAIAFLISRENAVTQQSIEGDRQWLEVRYVAEAGLEHLRHQLNNGGCPASGSLPSTPLGSHSYTASTTSVDASGSPAAVQITAVLANGVSRTFAFDNIPIRQAATATPLQPAGIGIDTYVSQTNSTTNYGNNGTLVVSDIGDISYALLHFDLSGIPSNSDIVGATLTLNIESNASTAANASVTAYRMLSTWYEAAATFSTSDGATAWTWPASYDSANPVDTAIVSSDIGQKTWDITELVTGWHTGVYANNGLVLTGNGLTDTVSLTSSDGLTAVDRPLLEVTHALECGETAAGANPELIAVQAETYLDQSQATVANDGVNPLLIGNQDAYRLLLYFDTSAISDPASVTQALIRLNVTAISGPGGASGTITVDVHPATTSDWTAGGATWNSHSAAYDSGTVVASTTLSDASSGTTVELDVTTWLQTGVNNGLMLVANSADQKTASIEATTAELDPTYPPP